MQPAAAEFLAQAMSQAVAQRARNLEPTWHVMAPAIAAREARSASNVPPSLLARLRSGLAVVGSAFVEAIVASRMARVRPEVERVRALMCPDQSLNPSQKVASQK
jgi:hypothetical protein